MHADICWLNCVNASTWSVQPFGHDLPRNRTNYIKTSGMQSICMSDTWSVTPYDRRLSFGRQTQRNLTDDIGIYMQIYVKSIGVFIIYIYVYFCTWLLSALSFSRSSNHENERTSKGLHDTGNRLYMLRLFVIKRCRCKWCHLVLKRIVYAIFHRIVHMQKAILRI